MARTPNIETAVAAKKVYEIIKNNPGITKSGIRKKMGLRDDYNIENILVSCEMNNLFLSEDGKGLYEWKLEYSENL